MRVYGVRPVFIRHPLKSFLLGVGLLVGLMVAMTGIAVLIVLLAAGGAAAWVYRLLRGPSDTAPPASAVHDAQVIDGEFEVVGERSKPADFSHRLHYDGPSRS